MEGERRGIYLLTYLSSIIYLRLTYQFLYTLQENSWINHSDNRKINELNLKDKYYKAYYKIGIMVNMMIPRKKD